MTSSLSAEWVESQMIPQIKWPGGKDFAFTIFDDPDLQTVDNVGQVYSFLLDLGFLATKAVWPIRGNGTREWVVPPAKTPNTSSGY